MGLIFDLDQTLVDSSIADQARRQRNWSHVYSLISDFSVYDGILECVRTVKEKRIPFAIVTSAPESYCNRVLSFFEVVCENRVCYHDTKLKKPHPEPILLAASRMSSELSNIYSFGDRDIDVTASNDAGVKSVACLWGAQDSRSLLSACPSLVLSSPNELLEFVLSF